MKFLKFTFVFIVFTGITFCNAQLLTEKNKFTHQDTLRGTITPERAWWDLTYYHLDINVDPDKKYISGKNTINYRVLENNNELQIDLQSPMTITKVMQDGEELNVRHDGNAHFVTLKSNQTIGAIKSVDVYYQGHPKEAERAPWDGGLSWKKDANGNHKKAF